MIAPVSISRASRLAWLWAVAFVGALTALTVWPVRHNLPQAVAWRGDSIGALERRIGTLESLNRVAESAELHHTLARLHSDLGKRLRAADRYSEAASAFQRAIAHRPELEGGWLYLYIADCLASAEEDGDQVRDAYEDAAAFPEPDVVLIAYDHLATLALANGDTTGYEYAETVSRFGKWSPKCRDAVLTGPDSKASPALWCRALAILSASPKDDGVREPAMAMLLDYQAARPWDSATRFYLDSADSGPSEIDLTKSFPAGDTSLTGGLILRPGRARRLAIYPTVDSLVTLTTAPAEVGAVVRVSLWVDGTPGPSYRSTSGDPWTVPVPGGHHVLTLQVPETSAAGVTLLSAVLESRI